MLVMHLRLVHGYLPGKNLRLKCAQTECGCVFGTFSGFRKHLNTKHTEYIDQQVDPDVYLSSIGETVTTNVEETVNEHEVATSTLLKKSNRSTLDVCLCCCTTKSSWIKSIYCK